MNIVFNKTMLVCLSQWTTNYIF